MVHTYNNHDLKNFLTVVEGFYFDNSYNNQFGHPYVDVSHLHDYIVTSHTHHARHKRLLRACSVYTPYGKRFLVITNIIHAHNSDARQIAGNLYPVINFESYGMRNPHLTNAVCDNCRVNDRIQMQAHTVEVQSHYDTSTPLDDEHVQKHVIHKSTL